MRTLLKAIAILAMAGIPAWTRAAEASPSIVWGPDSEIVASHTKASGLEGGQVPFSLEEERSPAGLFDREGFPYFGGVAADGEVTVWRILNESADAGNDAIDFLASDIRPGGRATMLVVWRCRTGSDGKYPKLQSYEPFKLRGSFTGSLVAFRGQARFAVLDSQGQWWISGESELVNRPTDIAIASLDDMQWFSYEPATALGQIGADKTGRPESVQAVGVWLSMERVSDEGDNNIGAAISSMQANLDP